MNNNKPASIPNVALAYVGAVVGAGFISGQELVQFFIQFNALGWIGWVLTILVIVIGGGFAIGKIAATKPLSFKSMIQQMWGPRYSRFATVVFTGYLVGGLVIMVSGAGSLITAVTGIALPISVGVVSIAILITILGKAERMLSINKLLIPVLIVFTLIAAILILAQVKQPNFPSAYVIKNPSGLLANWWISVVLYLGYNIIGALVGFVNIGQVTDSRNGLRGGLLGGVMIGFLGTLLMVVLAFTYENWKSSELPAVAVIQSVLGWMYPLYALGMFIAMYSVATNYALGVSRYVESTLSVGYRQICIGLMVLCAPLAVLGFSRLLGTIYPIFGILALVLLGLLIARRLDTNKVPTFVKKEEPA